MLSVYTIASYILLGIVVPSFIVNGASYHLPMDEILNGKIVGTFGGTLHNINSVEKGKRSNATCFNGQDQYIDYGVQRTNCFGDLHDCFGEFTLLVWLKFDDKPDSTKFILSSGGHTQLSHGITLFRKADGLGASFRTTSKSWYLWGFLDASLNVNTWYHVVLTWNENSNLTAYINSKFVATIGATAQANGNTYQKFIIGDSNALTQKGDQFCIDDLYIFDEIKPEAVISDGYFQYELQMQWPQSSPTMKGKSLDILTDLLDNSCIEIKSASVEENPAMEGILRQEATAFDIDIWGHDLTCDMDVTKCNLVPTLMLSTDLLDMTPAERGSCGHVCPLENALKCEGTVSIQQKVCRYHCKCMQSTCQRFVLWFSRNTPDFFLCNVTLVV